MPSVRARPLVLLVDDDSDSQFMYRKALEHSGFDVRVARDGNEGIAEARSDRPDLIVMDVCMPCVDGWQATRILKGDPSTLAIPIVILTASSSPDDSERAKNVGCDAFVLKPCDLTMLVNIVQRVLRLPTEAHERGAIPIVMNVLQV
jgi:CheY-like chemotaxis protein